MPNFAAVKLDAATYACVGTSDGIAPWRTMQRRLQSLSALGIPTEFHAYDRLPHGFGLGTGTVAEGWLTDAVRLSPDLSLSQFRTEVVSVPD